MTSAISSATATWPSFCGTGSAATSGSTSGTSGLTQTEQQLFAAIDTNGNGSISQSELNNFMSAMSGTANSTQSGTGGTLFSALDTSGSSGISPQDFQSNISTFLTALRSQLATASAATASSGASATTSASATAGASSATASGAAGSAHALQHGPRGHGGADALLASLMQQLSSSTAQSAAAAGASLSTLP